MFACVNVFIEWFPPPAKPMTGPLKRPAMSCQSAEDDYRVDCSTMSGFALYVDN